MADLPAHAQVVIIGGGAVGASCLYHLALSGVVETVLIEKNELTSGSTWHAAGNTPSFSGNLTIMKLQNYGSRLYDRLGEDVGYPMTRHRTGSVRLAQYKERMQEFEHVAAMANAAGIDMRPLTVSGMVDDYYPWMNGEGLVGGLWDPDDGDIDPAQLTQAFAKGARDRGAKIVRFTKVTGLNQRKDGSWDVATDKGDIKADVVVNAAGYHADEIGGMVGREIPMVTMSHQYLVTEAVSELEGLSNHIPLLRDPDDSYYLRQERQGLILGPYEWRATPHWLTGGTPEDFSFQLFEDDLDRLEWCIDAACKRVPMLSTAGVQKVINGPIPYAPDGLPLLGPAPGLSNFYEACVFTFGIAQAGGAGKAIAEYIVDGGPELDLWCVDPRRFGDYATKTYATVKAIEVYQNEYAINLPHRPWPAGRPAKTSPLYDRLASLGAQFGSFGGWERPLWFAGDGDRAEPDLTFGRPHFHEAIAREVETVTTNVGLLDLTGFSRFEIAGENAAGWLDCVMAGRLPRTGRVTLGYFCSPAGALASELTITRLEEDRFWLVGAASGHWHDRDLLQAHMPNDGFVTVEDLTPRHVTLALAGPKSRALLQSVAGEDIGDAVLPWMAVRPVTIGMARGYVMRMSYTGELGFELHMPAEVAIPVHHQLLAAGKEFGLGCFGMYALDSMRIEKGFRSWKQDLSTEFSPLASGLQRFVDLDKPSFVGRDALVREQENGSPLHFVMMELEPGDGAEAPGGAPVYSGSRPVGLVTSGGYGHRTGKSLALGYVPPKFNAAGCELEIGVFGERRPARVLAEAPFDPDNLRPRSKG
ncbi:FAD-dependent oxidoreductase [Hoeflea sp. WL0058]|uniref:FAD-dependent oxidoreductase n=1 Tax=Flavimaribacter sediminis TaxID=2865987 RepID=A0AAE2ZK36_9HYPH|nr:FAD-dependent oxidoreductase [Flavimaribacter sediminis]MBW8636040.1 FAD-dependent oxidoreductase [Flavimaribacter sediminis]